jgi:hypothetical protein
VNANPTPAVGQAWYNSTLVQGYLYNGITAPFVLDLGTNYANSVLSTSTGSQVFANNLATPASFLNFVNRTVRVTFQGTATLGGTNTVTLALYANATQIWSQALGATLAASAQFRGEIDILTAATGASGQLAVFGQLISNNATLVPVTDYIVLNAGTVVNLTSTSGTNLYFAMVASSTILADTVNLFYTHWELKQ